MSDITSKSFFFFFSDAPLAGRPQPWCLEDEIKGKEGERGGGGGEGEDERK